MENLDQARISYCNTYQRILTSRGTQARIRLATDLSGEPTPLLEAMAQRLNYVVAVTKGATECGTLLEKLETLAWLDRGMQETLVLCGVSFPSFMECDLQGPSALP